MNSYTKIVKTLMLTIIFILFIYFYRNFPLYNKEGIIDFFEQLQESNYTAILFIVLTSVLTIFFVPISWFVAVGAIFFGLVRGFAYSLAGATLGAIICFVITRTLRGDNKSSESGFIYKMLKKKSMNERFNIVSRNIEIQGLKYMFFLRNVPLVPFTILNYLSGMSSISFKNYAFGSVFGMIPGIFISTFFFTRAVQVVENPKEAILATIIKIIYFLLILIWERRSRLGSTIKTSNT
jgi:uncharacterized membrane protein YdjX (TVP38/TMEM64 family)